MALRDICWTRRIGGCREPRRRLAGLRDGTWRRVRGVCDGCSVSVVHRAPSRRSRRAPLGWVPSCVPRQAGHSACLPGEMLGLPRRQSAGTGCENQRRLRSRAFGARRPRLSNRRSWTRRRVGPRSSPTAGVCELGGVMPETAGFQLVEPRFSQSLERGLAILRCFDPEHPIRRIVDIAEELGMSRSSWVGGEAPVSLATGGFLAAARRTGLAGFLASGSPQAMRCPLFESWSGVSDLGPIGESGFPCGRPRRGDVVSALAVPFDFHLAGPVEPCAVGAGPVAPPVPSLDLCPGQPLVLLAQPSDYSPPQVVVEIVKAARGLFGRASSRAQYAPHNHRTPAKGRGRSRSSACQVPGRARNRPSSRGPRRYLPVR
jgi:hypothetical protein